MGTHVHVVRAAQATEESRYVLIPTCPD